MCILLKNLVRHTRKHRIDQLESLIDLFTDLCSGQDDLTTNEDQEHNLGLHHTIDQTREELRLVRREIVMATSQTLKTDRELDVARADNVLDLEVGELGVETELLDDTGVFARGKLRVILRLGTGDNHLARCEDKGGSLGFTDTHDNGGETLR